MALKDEIGGGKPGFTMRREWRPFLQTLDGETLKDLIMLMFEFDERGELPDISNQPKEIQVAFSVVRIKLASDRGRYIDRCKVNSENAKRRRSKQSQTTANDR